MNKFITLIILLLLSLAFMIPSVDTSTPVYRSTDLEKIKNGDTIEYRLNGQLTYASDLHYARIVKTKSDNQVLEQYFNTKGQPAKQSAGHYALRRVYDGSYEVLTTYLDAELQPITNTSGFCTRERVYQDGHVIEEWYKDVNGNPAANKSGAYGRRNVWEGKRNTGITYLDENGAPHCIKSGYAELRRTFYEEKPWKGKVKENFYFDEAGLPVSLAKGQYGVRYEYDETGTKSRTDYLGIDGNIISSTVYPAKSIEMYLDANGQPQQQSAGHYGILKRGGRTIYLDAEGKRIFNLKHFLNDDLSAFLHESPGAVITIGTGVLMLSFLLSRRASILLVLYIVFILYMTLWNRDGESRAKLGLFWSYQQFFSSASLRLEIMNNIWLFIPLGGILARLGCKKSIPICVGLSIGIELLQYITGFGLAEFDDVISNGLGGAIGVGMYELWKKHTSPERKIRLFQKKCV